jgi:ABC-type multidrug transport system fused ATPase/permease subunit
VKRPQRSFVKSGPLHGYLLTDVWLTLWIASLPKNPPYPVTLPDNTSLTLVPNSTPRVAAPSSPSRTEPVFKIDLAHGGFYFVLGFSHVVFYVLTSVWAFVIGVKASRTLHFEMIKRIVHAAPLSWFEKTPSGRILSRFTSDLQVVDTRLTMDIDTVANSIGISLSLFVYVAIVVPILVIVLVIMILSFGFLAWIADTLMREARRMANNTVSSILSAVSENKDGTALIRAMRLQAFFVARQSANIEIQRDTTR